MAHSTNDDLQVLEVVRFLFLELPFIVKSEYSEYISHKAPLTEQLPSGSRPVTDFSTR